MVQEADNPTGQFTAKRGANLTGSQRKIVEVTRAGSGRLWGRSTAAKLAPRLKYV